MKSRNPVLPCEYHCLDEVKSEEALPAYQACQVKNAYINNDRLVIGKGHSEIFYRYIDTGTKVSSVVFDGNGEAVLSYK